MVHVVEALSIESANDVHDVAEDDSPVERARLRSIAARVDP